ncbi:glycosyltransferase family 4 protein [Cohnella lubricantis]|uniref:Glycosyltransferase family 4 protein n=1 Tax=Cohnella lubricantis TaxID=2163172 RepID=A0A841T7G3_9BACL|nr:glycosyltransferase family 4 protein [Cohnella lubricantis]MBB6676842.1 glycosyltransferase family 4 protein [Cohnella lubricantis]MBP2119422.1 glycosyltransferase involved in cell wall biosynthesis [Cohnella lubricantis]
MNILSTGMGWIDHTPGGLNRYFADYLHAMSASGHRMTGFMTASGEPTGAPAYVREVLEGIGGGTLSRMMAFRTQVRKELAEGRYDVLNPHFALYASLLRRSLIPVDVPIVTHFHGPWAQESRYQEGGSDWSQRMRYRVKREIESLSYRRSDRFIVLSEYFKTILRDDYGVAGDRIHIVPGAVDTDSFHPAKDRAFVRHKLGLPADKLVLFCARRLVPRMGIDRLIRSMALAADRAEHVSLYIAGDGPMRAELQRLTDALGLRGSVRLLGRVSNEELVEWYQSADIAVVPTITLEGFGLVTVEALACGTPVLGTPGGGTVEILSKLSDDLLFSSGEPEAMADKIAAAAEGTLRVPDREQCRRFVMENYTWERVARTVTGIFEQAIQERKGRRTG